MTFQVKAPADDTAGALSVQIAINTFIIQKSPEKSKIHLSRELQASRIWREAQNDLLANEHCKEARRD